MNPFSLKMLATRHTRDGFDILNPKTGQRTKADLDTLILYQLRQILNGHVLVHSSFVTLCLHLTKNTYLWQYSRRGSGKLHRYSGLRCFPTFGVVSGRCRARFWRLVRFLELSDRRGYNPEKSASFFANY